MGVIYQQFNMLLEFTVYFRKMSWHAIKPKSLEWCYTAQGGSEISFTCSKPLAILWMWSFVRFDCVLNDLALSGGVRRLCTLSACVQSEEITQNSLKILPHNTSCKKSSWYFWHSLKNIAAIRMPTYRQVLLGLGGAGAAYIYFKPRPKPFHIKVRKHQW